MSEFAVTLEELVSWLRSKELTPGNCDVKLADLRERRAHLPAAAADFDSTRAIGRINAWVSGEVDFEVLRREDGADVFFKHEEISGLDDSRLEESYAEFLRYMMNPDLAPPTFSPG
jgi:hypothetical protein